MNVLIDVSPTSSSLLLLSLLLSWRWLTNCVVNLFNKWWIQIRCDYNILLPHLLNVSVGLLVVPRRVEEFDQLSEDITQPDGFLNTRRVCQLITKLNHSWGISIVEGFSGFHELLNHIYTIFQHPLLHLLILSGNCFLKLSLCLFHSP